MSDTTTQPSTQPKRLFEIVQGQDAFQRVIARPRSVVIFKADWCEPCKDYQAQLEQSTRFAEYSQEHGLYLALVDIGQNMDLALENNVRSVPLTRAYSRGRSLGSNIGSMKTTDLILYLAEWYNFPREMARV